MMLRTHLAAGAAAASLAVGAGLLPAHPAVLAVAVGGAMLPDLDHTGGWLGRRAWFLSWPIRLVFGHRGFTHSLVGGLAFSAVILIMSQRLDATLAFGLGYLSHVLADALTERGVPLLWPFSKRYGPRIFRTDGWVEPTLSMFFAAVAALPWIVALRG